MTRGILDTSVFIAAEQGHPPAARPDDAAISVVTLAELHLGVLVAEEAATRARRLQTLLAVERELQAVPVDAAVARTFGAIVAEARRFGRRPNAMDAFIAATAVTHGVPVYTQDADFDAFPGLEVIRI